MANSDKSKDKSNTFTLIYEEVKKIPKGKVATYGHIAMKIGNPKFSQVVGFALHSNPDPINIPCHRVVNRFGAVASSFAFGGADEQRNKLTDDGITFLADGNVDMKKHNWLD